VNIAYRHITPSPNTIDAEEDKASPTRIRRTTLDSLPDVYRKAGYALFEKGELEIVGTGGR